MQEHVVKSGSDIPKIMIPCARECSDYYLLHSVVTYKFTAILRFSTLPTCMFRMRYSVVRIVLEQKLQSSRSKSSDNVKAGISCDNERSPSGSSAKICTLRERTVEAQMNLREAAC